MKMSDACWMEMSDMHDAGINDQISICLLAHLQYSNDLCGELQKRCMPDLYQWNE